MSEPYVEWEKTARTPSTSDVKDAWVDRQMGPTYGHGKESYAAHVAACEAEFDRWLASHDATLVAAVRNNRTVQTEATTNSELLVQQALRAERNRVFTVMQREVLRLQQTGDKTNNAIAAGILRFGEFAYRIKGEEI